MSVSDLTNTKWVFKNSVDLNVISGGGNGSVHHSITFISNNITYSELSIYKSTSATYTYNLYYDNTSVLHANWSPTDSWTNSAFRIIKITGGTGVTSSSLIQWLEANATQIQVDDLTDTKWVFKNEIDLSSSQVNFNINFTSNNVNYTNIRRYPIDNGILNYNSTTVCVKDVSDVYTWEDEAYRIIEITGGDDVSNPDLLVWLNNNATLVPVVDLSNTKWYFNSVIDLPTSTYSINFESNGIDYDNIKYWAWELGGMKYNVDGVYLNGEWSHENYRTISITDGTDIINPDLIAWLSQNATLQEPIPPVILGKKLLKFNNKNVSKVNNKIVKAFNRIEVFCGIESNAPIIEQDGNNLYIYRTEAEQQGNEVII